jgi:hypothetical protein
MKTLPALSLLLVSTFAHADERLLDPGAGTQYLAQWCGGQNINEIATGFNADSSASTLVQVSAKCSTGGRGGGTKTYYACWRVDFDRLGQIVDRQHIGNVPCPETDPSATYTDVDGAVLSTTVVTYISGSQRQGYRAILSR